MKKEKNDSHATEPNDRSIDRTKEPTFGSNVIDYQLPRVLLRSFDNHRRNELLPTL